MSTLMSAFAAPIDGNPGPVQLVASPPTLNSCDAPISTIGGLNVNSQGADFSLSNTSSTTSQDALIFDVWKQGVHHLYWAPVGLHPGRAVVIHATFLAPVDTPVVLLCKNHPWGINDDGAPVVAVVAAPPDGQPQTP
jgi:hypothetical protein